MRRGQEIFSDSVLLSNTVYLKGQYKNSTYAPLEQEKEFGEKYDAVLNNPILSQFKGVSPTINLNAVKNTAAIIDVRATFFFSFDI